MDDTTKGAARPSRRVLARGAAWSVPVVAVGAAAPAMAASGGTGGITGACAGGPTATFTFSVSGSLSSSIQVVFTRLGGTGFTVTPPPTWVLVSTSNNIVVYEVPVVGGAASGSATVTYQMGRNGTELVTAEISTPTGQVITGDTSASVNISRDGNSSNYNCAVTG